LPRAIVHIDASLIRADVSWESLAVRYVEATKEANGEVDETAKTGRQTGKYKKVCTTDPDATMATTARNRRLEPAYKQHTVVDDLRGVVLDVAVTTGEVNEGQVVATMATTGVDIATVTADAGHAYAKVYGALERRRIDTLISTKAEPIRSTVPLRRFRYDARHDVVKCPRGKVLRPGRRVKHGRFFYARARDCSRCSLASACRRAGSARRSSSATTIRLSSGPAGAATAGPAKTGASTNAIAGVRRGFMAKRRPGMVSPAPSAVASTTCRFPQSLA
jgi:hypothetical protein